MIQKIKTITLISVTVSLVGIVITNECREMIVDERTLIDGRPMEERVTVIQETGLVDRPASTKTRKEDHLKSFLHY